MFEFGQQVRVSTTEVTGVAIARHGRNEGRPGFLGASMSVINLYADIIIDTRGAFRAFIHSALVAA